MLVICVVADEVESQRVYSISRVSAVPRCANRVMTWNLSLKGMVAESSGRTPNEGGPGHQLLSPSSARTAARVGLAPYKSDGWTLVAVDAGRTVQALAIIATSATAETRREHL